LARSRFAAKTPDYEGWIFLDFLGFSRPKRDLSMGYEEKSRKVFSQAAFLMAAVWSASSGASGRGHAEGQDCS
jgi:hypothetical protein